MLVVQQLRYKGYDLDLKTFFSLRTAEKIAIYLENTVCPEKAKELTIPREESPKQNHITFETELSPQQKNLWFLTRMFPGRDAYIISIQIEFEGQVDAARLKHSFNCVVINNMDLRSAIQMIDYVPTIVRLSGTECFCHLGQEMIQDPQLNGPSLITGRLADLGHSYQMDIRLHHLVGDGRSLAIIGEQLVQAYNEGSLPKTDLVSQSLEGHDDGSLQFWRTYLEDHEPLVSNTMGDTGVEEGEAGYIEEDFKFVRKNELKEFCAKWQCTLFQLLVLCYIQTVRLMYDISDVVIGTTVANRTPANINTVGHIVNTIPLRFREEFTGLVGSLSYFSQQILSAIQHQTTPLASIVQEVMEHRDNTSIPLFQKVLTLESTSIHELPPIVGVKTRITEPRTRFAQFEQSWIFSEKNKVSLLIQFDRSRCSTKFMNELLKTFKQTLKCVLRRNSLNPSQSPYTMSPSVDVPLYKSLGRAFEEQVSMLPYNIGFESRDCRLDFQGFLRSAATFAGKIEEVVVKHFGEELRKDDVICIILKESIENHIAIMSVHLLGCAYVCLSQETPLERVRYILSDCCAKLLITDSNVENVPVPALEMGKVSNLGTENRHLHLARSCSNSLAYLIYTSGTTGAPKGVCVNHQSAMNMLEHATRHYGFKPRTRVLQFTKSFFDASISNTFGSLLNGGILTIRDEEAEVVKGLRAHQPIAVLHMTPAILEMFEEQELIHLRGIERWSFGGETISETVLRVMIDRGERLVQLYGPTEATCYQTMLNMKRNHSPTTLGPVIPGLSYGLCSSSNSMVRRSTVGQLFFTGENLARGYISNGIRKGFLENPYRTTEERLLRKNHRIYLVGDKVRVDTDGYLNFYGRNDDQVKVRGCRVQLSEIENIARSIDGVENAVAVVQKDKARSKHIVLFYVGRFMDLKKDLQEQIPAQAMPSKVVLLTEFPLTRNKKIDRVKLSLRNDLGADDQTKRKPSDEVEAQLLDCYQKLLKQSKLSVDTNFFQAGGHSLLVVRLVDELERKLKVKVPIVKVFELPVVEQLAKWIRDALQTPNKASTETYINYSNQVTSLQNTLLRSFRSLQIQQIYELTLNVRLKKEISRKTLVVVLNRLTMIHSSLRTKFARSENGFVREVLSGTECFQNLKSTEGGLLNVFEKPPFLATLDDRNTVKVAVSHVIIDGYSLQLITESLTALLEGNDLEVDDGLELNSWLQNQLEERLYSNIEYWKGILAHHVYNQLPTSRPRLAVNSPEANSDTFTVSQLIPKLEFLAQSHGSTPFIVVLSALSRVLQLHSCDRKLPFPVGFPVNLRTHALRNSVGYGISTIFVAEDASGPIEKVLEKVTVEVGRAVSHAFLPYEELVQLSPSMKLFNVMLMYDSYSVYENEVLMVEPAAAAVTKFEMSIFIDSVSNSITVEYYKSLYDRSFVEILMRSLQAVLCDWEDVFVTVKPQALHLGGVVYDTSDIKRALVGLDVKDISVDHHTDLVLYYSSDIRKDDAVESCLKKLPKALRPKRIVFREPIQTFEFALSPQQHQMYFLHLKDPHKCVLPFLKKFPKTIPPLCLQQALLYEMQRHESLRTVFLEKNGDIRQLTLSMTESYVSLNIEKVDEFKEPLERFMKSRLNLSEKEIPFRAKVFKSDDCFVACLLLHHIVSDAWSTGMLEKELDQLVDPLQKNQTPSLHRQKFSYRDYCEKSQSTTTIDQKYLTMLSKAERIPLSSGNGTVKVHHFSFTETTALYWTKHYSSSLFNVLLAMLSECLLYEFDLLSINVGSPYSNRTASTRSIFGYFLNNVVFHIEREDVVEPTLRRIQDHVGEVLHRNAPFVQLVSELRKSHCDTDPLFQVYFNCRYSLESDITDDDDLLSILPVKSEFPLEVDLDKHPSGYRVTFRAQDCFGNRAAMSVLNKLRQRILGETVSSGLVEPTRFGSQGDLELVVNLAANVLNVDEVDPEENFFSAGGNSLQLIDYVERLEETLNVEVDISVLYRMESFIKFAKQLRGSRECTTAEQREEMIREPPPHTQASSEIYQASFAQKMERSNEIKKESLTTPRRVDTPRGPLHKILSEIMQRNRTRIALVEASGKEHCYEEWSNSIQETAVTIRNAYTKISGETLRNDTIIAVLGDRSSDTLTVCLSAMAAGAAYLPIDSSSPLGRKKTLLKESKATCYSGLAVAEAELPLLSISNRPCKRRVLLNSNCVDDLGYVIYTSGTTGVPKGVCVKHDAILNMMTSSTVDFRMKPSDVTYQFTIFCYDNSVLEMFMTLANGAKLLVDDCPFLPRRFVELIDKHSITHCLLFPGVVSTFTSKHFRKLSDLRYWIVGAERLPQALLDTAIGFGINVIQNYGPTEMAAYALTKRMKNTDLGCNLGGPIQNTIMKVTDDDELWLKGKGQMRCYLGWDTIDILKSGGWYATGDRVRQLPNGDVLFFGRRDEQIKIRGHRVELGEIESLISGVTGVKQCKVVLEENEQRLLAFVTVSSELDDVEGKIQARCVEYLPSHMIPAQIMVLSAFPLTKNSKIDVQQLLEEWKASTKTAQLVVLAEKLLERHIDSGLSLLESGGATKEAIQLFRLYQQKYGSTLDLVTLFKCPLRELRQSEHSTEKYRTAGTPDAAIDARLRKIWSKVLKRDDIQANDHFFFCGGNSLSLIKLRAEINREFNTMVDINDLLSGLVFKEMVTTISSLSLRPKITTVILANEKPTTNLVFVHPLYGGTLSYTSLINALRKKSDLHIIGVQHPNSFGFVTEDLRFFDSVQSLAEQYANKIAAHLSSSSRVVLIGASLGGTLAVEMSNYLKVPCDVIALDAGTDYEKIKEILFQEHKKTMNEALDYYEVDDNTRFWMTVNSWDLLQMLAHYSPAPPRNLKKLHLFSVDGSDLGWSSVLPTSVTKIAGTHENMLSEEHSSALADNIVRILSHGKASA
ncbi:hypothetical protein Q1695_006467 [Nippostrongylus brasiliensis]|nr:hypothetical protein Q1695_006467 [Nippostrongylus brasiliensis]